MAVREIKTTLALDGEKQYKASLDEAYRAMRVLGSEMKATNAASSALIALSSCGSIRGSPDLIS